MCRGRGVRAQLSAWGVSSTRILQLGMTSVRWPMLTLGQSLALCQLTWPSSLRQSCHLQKELVYRGIENLLH